jgi:hypothetical protein
MATRFATLRDVHLEVETSHLSITLSVQPFVLLHLLWLCLHASIKACSPGQLLVLKLNKTNNTAEIRYGPLPEISDNFVQELHASQEMQVLLDTLEGSLSIDPKQSALLLTFKKNDNTIGRNSGK